MIKGDRNKTNIILKISKRKDAGRVRHNDAVDVAAQRRESNGLDAFDRAARLNRRHLRGGAFVETDGLRGGAGRYRAVGHDNSQLGHPNRPDTKPLGGGRNTSRRDNRFGSVALPTDYVDGGGGDFGHVAAYAQYFLGTDGGCDCGRIVRRHGADAVGFARDVCGDLRRKELIAWKEYI